MQTEQLAMSVTYTLQMFEVIKISVICNLIHVLASCMQTTTSNVSSTGTLQMLEVVFE